MWEYVNNVNINMRFFWIDASLFIITALLNVLLMFQLFIIKPLLFFLLSNISSPTVESVYLHS